MSYKIEIAEDGPLGLFYPKMLMKEFYIRSEDDIRLGQTTVRYKNGTCKCIVTDKDDVGNYILWDGGGASLSIRRKNFEQLKKDCVIVKFLDESFHYEGKEIKSIEDLHADYSAMDDGYNYREVFKYFRHKETGEIRRFECRSIKESIWHGPGDVDYLYNDYSHVLKRHELNLHAEITMEHTEILKNWELIVPVFKDYNYYKKEA